MQMRESLLPNATRFETDQWPRVTFKSPKEWFSENRQRFWDSRCRLPQIVFPIASCGRTSSDIPCPDSANKQGSDAGYETARRQPASSYCFISVYLFFRLVYQLRAQFNRFLWFLFSKTVHRSIRIRFAQRFLFDFSRRACKSALRDSRTVKGASRVEFESRNHVTWSLLPRFSIKTRASNAFDRDWREIKSA